MKTTRVAAFLAASLAALSCGGVAHAERRPVLQQIDVPHDYYFREMYLPQLTSGPSALSWSPDGLSIVYSMQGSLWRQDLDSSVARQLTAGPGYDYQPDWSPDGRRIAFVRYLDDAMEIQVLDLDSGETSALTSGGAVNVEPRWSPDGSRMAWVSTEADGRFRLFVGDMVEGTLDGGPLLPARESRIERYYYSRRDHQISPAWSPDGSEILYVANPEIGYGTGSIWRKRADGRGAASLVRKEETSWRAKPDWAPDGRRIAYASYLGRQWHQLWVTTADAVAEPFPLTYGDFDISAPRWSPSGDRIAYISNEPGNTEIRIQELVGGRNWRLDVGELEYLRPMADLDLSVVDDAGEPLSARVSIVASDQRSYAPTDVWVHGDDSFDRELQPFETHYFHTDGHARLKLPPGAARVTVWRGPEYGIERLLINVLADQDNTLTVTPGRLATPETWRDWYSADIHVHMNYGGTYRNTPARLIRQAAAEDLDLVYNLVVNKEQRMPDIAYFRTDPDPASTNATILMHSQEYHTSYWGHMGLLGLRDHLLLPGYAAYPGTAAASLYPDNATISRLARQQGAAVGYVHPFLPPAPDPATDATLTNAFPLDAALGLVDYYEVVGFADPRTSAEVWYRLMNCGVRVAAAGGTDAMANYASLRGPVGINRTYVQLEDAADDPAVREAAWLDGLKAGRSMATNGPLVDLMVDGHRPGESLALPAAGTVSVSGFMRSAVPVDHVEIVVNGKVAAAFDRGRDGRAADFDTDVGIDASGWLLLRACNDGSDPLVFDLYPYATTTPVWITVGGEPPRSAQDAAYFVAWMDRIRSAAAAHGDYNAAAERDAVLANVDAAAARFEACRP